MALKSMTGYGRAEMRDANVRLSAEILSVNRKHLDINLVIPRHLHRFDPLIRRRISESILRGHVTVRITVGYEKDSPLTIKPNLALAHQMYLGWEQLTSALGLKKEDISLSLLAGEPDLFIDEEAPFMADLGAMLTQCVDEALVPFNLMRKLEGEHLERDILARLQVLRQALQEIKANSKDASLKYRAKLLEKMQAALPLVDGSDDRIIKEIVLFAEKVDIEEEIVRFSSHIEKLEALILSPSPNSGKTAEFLIQELGREVNTMGSKTLEMKVTNSVIEIKTELERIREQIQNIE